MNNNYIMDNKFIKSDATDSNYKPKHTNSYQIRDILDTSKYNKRQSVKVEKWTIVMR